MTHTNATSVKEMLHEIELLVKDQSRSEQIEMLNAIEVGLHKLQYAAEWYPEPDESDHERKLAAADNRADFKKGNQI
jgi:hypothetical protein